MSPPRNYTLSAHETLHVASSVCEGDVVMRSVYDYPHLRSWRLPCGVREVADVEALVCFRSGPTCPCIVHIASWRLLCRSAHVCSCHHQMMLAHHVHVCPVWWMARLPVVLATASSTSGVGCRYGELLRLHAVYDFCFRKCLPILFPHHLLSMLRCHCCHQHVLGCDCVDDDAVA